MGFLDLKSLSAGSKVKELSVSRPCPAGVTCSGLKEGLSFLYVVMTPKTYRVDMVKLRG